ncbi:MAG: hypothetical protein J0M35_20125 [Candidatus Obscuribacter phosphatis]|uniref:Uncharacterized protein n=1 Tax=Candidatus Obscuribacter phosphatis TaxID=1906157 RepID=A0A8J7PAT4_9BACT|nr:hypothetical protein [Candidatus Obscuribacter phosphatis]
MKLHFEDFGIEPQPSRDFDDATELGSFLESQRAKSIFCQLSCDNGYKLQFGIDGDLGCAQFLGVDEEPPYLVAVTPIKVVESSHDFDLTGSATEVASENCLPFDLLKRIVLKFLETGAKSSLVEWVDC